MAFEQSRGRYNSAMEALLSRESRVDGQIAEFQAAKEAILGSSGLVTVHIGEGWFVQRSVEDAVDYLNRRLDGLDEEKAKIQSLLLRPPTEPVLVSREPKPDLGQEPASKVSNIEPERREPREPEPNEPKGLNQEEPSDMGGGFPLMDIREEIDDDGNIISATVQPHGADEFAKFAEDTLGKSLHDREQEIKAARDAARDMQKMKQQYDYVDGKPMYGPPKPVPISRETKPTDSKPKRKVQGQMVYAANSSRESESSIPQNSRIVDVTDQEKEKEEAKEKINEKGKEMEERKEERKEGSQTIPSSQTTTQRNEQPISQPNHPSIVPEELLELELIAEDVDDENDIEWEYDEDYDEEDEEDEDEYGRSSASYAVLDKTELEKRSRAAEEALKEAIAAKNEPDKGDKKVRFSTQADVKIFDKTKPSRDTETADTEVGVLAAPEEPKKRVSRFKAERMEGSVERLKNLSLNDSRPPVNPIGDVQERPVNDIQERPASDIQERPVGDIKERPIGDIKERPVGDIKERPVGDIVERPVNNITGGPVGDVKERPAGKIVEPPAGKDFSMPNRHQKIPPALLKDPQKLKKLKVTSLKSEDSLVQPIPADQDSQEDKTIPPEVYDLAKQYFGEASITEEEFLAAHDIDEDDDDYEGEGEGEQDQGPSGLMTNVIEHDNPEFDQEEFENEPDMGQIANQYQRLRSKFINASGGFRKSDQEMALEPVDEDGNPIKMSRFKAARLYNR
uniref:ARAD1B03564p n=1 Tax=Blastobotrys adeninivorans TaxID=409370 RepID=A0A060T5C9_BLAAD